MSHMAVAVKTTAVEVALRNPRQVLMVRSVVGALYILGSLWLVFVGLPAFWRVAGMARIFNEFLADSLLLLVTLPVIFGLFLLGRILEGPNPAHGVRGCAVFLSSSVIIFGLLIGAGAPIWSVIGMVLLGAALFLFFLQPRFLEWLVQCEEQGWFHAVPYKANQGLRVRRSTVVGLMVLVLCGIFTLVSHGTLRTGRWLVAGEPPVATDPWVVTMPFGTDQYIFMYHITLTLPVVLLVLAGWLAWRLVNWPVFADFLIATEAEMNKVSWTTRKRLYQDTIVVLTTVVLMTVFLFVLDILWVKILTSPVIRVLKFDTQEAVRKNQSGAQW
jgi:preprotein translocase SecE subunit